MYYNFPTAWSPFLLPCLSRLIPLLQNRQINQLTNWFKAMLVRLVSHLGKNDLASLLSDGSHLTYFQGWRMKDAEKNFSCTSNLDLQLFHLKLNLPLLFLIFAATLCILKNPNQPKLHWYANLFHVFALSFSAALQFQWSNNQQYVCCFFFPMNLLYFALNVNLQY